MKARFDYRRGRGQGGVWGVIILAWGSPACAPPSTSRLLAGEVAGVGTPTVERAAGPAVDEASSQGVNATGPVGQAASAERVSPPPGDANLRRGEELFTRQCAVCHGDAGDGAGKFAYLMNPRPRDFRKGNFKLATTVNQIPTEADLVRTISRGMPGSAMPPWGHLPVSDLEALAAYVRFIHGEATNKEVERAVANQEATQEEAAAWVAKRTQPGPPIVVPPEPMFDNTEWFTGRRIYLEACASCHGVDGQPVTDAVKFDAEGYPVPPRSFVNGIFKGGSEGHQLYVRIVKGLKGTPMPGSEDVYSANEVWALIHYVQSLARIGAQGRAQLQQGTFAAPTVRGSLPEGPMDPAWQQARPLYVAMTPLWWTEDRVEGVIVQALHNDEELAIRLSWLDPTVDDRAVRHDEFRDAVAVQFSMSSDPPFYMGDASEHGGVNIWMWKADRQKNIASGYQDTDHAFPDAAVDDYPEPAHQTADPLLVDRPHDPIIRHVPEFVTAWGAGNLVADPQLQTPVECLVARGPGTLSGKLANVQFVKGQAVYERGVWYVQMQRTLALPDEGEHAAGDERAFRAGDYLPVSFAIWNGSAGDRDGKKNISIWQKLVIE